MAWDLSCPDWDARIRERRSLVPELPLVRSEADRAVQIFDRLRLPDVPGTPELADAAGEWSREIVAVLFGSWDGERRHVRELFELVPKKNAKTTIGAAIMLIAMLMNRRPRAEYLLVAPTQAISDLAYGQAEGMILADAELAKRFHLQPHIKRITYRGPVRSTLQVKTFDADILTGSKAIGVLIDELHLLGRIASAARVLGQLRGGLLPFPEAFIVMITTQSDEPPAGIFADELINARMIRDGRRPANGTLPILYELPTDIVTSGAWRDPACWPMVTPNIGRSIDIDRLNVDYANALEKGEGELRRWASQHLNIEIGLALRSDRWAGADYWETCGDCDLTLDRLLERSEVVVIGIDGGGLDDLLGLAVLGRETGTGDWLIWTHAYAHRIVLERRKAEVAPRLEQFAGDGDVSLVDTVGDDVMLLAEIVDQVDAAGKLPAENAIGVDVAGIGAIVDELSARGIEPPGAEHRRIVGISQGWKLNGAIKTLERKLAGRAVRHANAALMAWCVGNARVEPRGNAITITKQASGTGKIDPLMAVLNAVALMALNPDGQRSVYDDPQRADGFLVL